MARGEHYHVQLQTKKTADYSSVIIVQTSDKVEKKVVKMDVADGNVTTSFCQLITGAEKISV